MLQNNFPKRALSEDSFVKVPILVLPLICPKLQLLGGSERLEVQFKIFCSSHSALILSNCSKGYDLACGLLITIYAKPKI